MTHLIIGDPGGHHSLYLIEQGVNPADITVWEDDASHCALVKAIDPSITVVNSLDDIDSMHFSHTIGNPPYLKNTHLKFMDWALDHSDSISLIHPAGWLYRDTVTLEKQVKSKMRNRVRSVTVFNGNTVFDGAEFACPLVLTEVVKDHRGSIRFKSNISGQTYYLNSLDEFPTGYWEPTEEHLSAVASIQALSVCGSVYDLVSTYEDGSLFVRCPRVVGDGRSKREDNYATYDFHTFMYRNSNLDNAKQGDKVFAVSSPEEVASLKSYLKTKLARFGLSINKVSQDLYIKRYLDVVPLPPLDREWTDESVMCYYGISEEQQQYICNFIPDYY